MSKFVSDEFVEAVNTDFENGLFNIRKFNADGFLIIGIEHMAIKCPENGKPFLHLKENISSEYMKVWNNDIGGVLLRDMKKYGKENLYELYNKKHKILLKRITDDELKPVGEKGFLHLKIGDYLYMIIKCVGVKDTYSSMTYEFVDRVEDDDDDELDAETEMEKLF